MVWTGLKESARENSEYSAQIYPYHGRVYVEILSRKHSKDSKSSLWLSVMDKSFGSGFNSAPREKDWIKAKEWMDEQFNLINKHGTALLTTPQQLR